MNRGSKKEAFSLIEIILVVGLLGILLGIAIPNYLGTRRDAMLNACLANQRVVRDAIFAYASETIEMTGEEDIDNALWYSYLREEALPECPAMGGAYQISGQYNNPSVSCTTEGH